MGNWSLWLPKMQDWYSTAQFKFDIYTCVTHDFMDKFFMSLVITHEEIIKIYIYMLVTLESLDKFIGSLANCMPGVNKFVLLPVSCTWAMNQFVEPFVSCTRAQDPMNSWSLLLVRYLWHCYLMFVLPVAITHWTYRISWSANTSITRLLSLLSCSNAVIVAHIILFNSTCCSGSGCLWAH